MQRIQIKPSLSPDVAKRFTEIADRYGMTAPGLASVLITEFSHIRKECLFEALGAIPADLKARPVGRPVGSTSARVVEKTAAQAAS